MKKLLLIFLIVHTFLAATTQKWGKTIGFPNRSDWAHDIFEYYDRGYFLVGGYQYNNQLPRNWNIKTDVNANVLWDKTLINPPELIISKTTTDSEGNTYLCGRTTIDSYSCPLLTKLNPCGQIEWCRMFYDTYFTIEGAAVDILINNNNEIILLVFVQNEDQVDQIFLFGYTTDGEYLWKQAYASKNDYPQIAAAAPRSLISFNNDYIISGFCYWPFPDDPNHFWLRPFFIGVDSLFNEKWILPFAVMDSVFGEAYSAIKINDTIIMGVGMRWLNGNNKNTLLMFFDNNGAEKGFHQIENETIGPEIDFNGISDIEKINDSLFISPCYLGINGELFFGEFIFDTLGTLYKSVIRENYTGNNFIIRTTDNNYLIKVGIEDINGNNDIYLYKVNDNLEMVPFDTNQYTYDSLCPEPIPSGSINLGDCDLITDIGELPSPQEYYASIKTIPITAFPNPAETDITLAFQNTDHHTNMRLECFNIYGQQVHTEKIWKGQQETRIDLRGWAKGLYFAVVKSEGKVVGRCKIVVK